MKQNCPNIENCCVEAGGSFYHFIYIWGWLKFSMIMSLTGWGNAQDLHRPEHCKGPSAEAKQGVSSQGKCSGGEVTAGKSWLLQFQTSPG